MALADLRYYLESRNPSLAQNPTSSFEEKLSTLTELHWDPCMQERPELERVLSHCPRLQVLHIDFFRIREGVPANWDGLLARVGDLRELYLGGSFSRFRFDMHEISNALLARCPNLTCLSLTDVKFAPSGLDALARLTQLQTLILIHVDVDVNPGDFRTTTLTEEHIKKLKPLTQLRYIDLADNRWITDKIFSVFRKEFPELRGVDLRATYASVPKIVDRLAKKPLAHLHKLCLDRPCEDRLAADPEFAEKFEEAINMLRASETLDTVYIGRENIKTARNHRQLEDLFTRMCVEGQVTTSSIRRVAAEERHAPSLPPQVMMKRSLYNQALDHLATYCPTRNVTGCRSNWRVGSDWNYMVSEYTIVGSQRVSRCLFNFDFPKQGKNYCVRLTDKEFYAFARLRISQPFNLLEDREEVLSVLQFIDSALKDHFFMDRRLAVSNMNVHVNEADHLISLFLDENVMKLAEQVAEFRLV